MIKGEEVYVGGLGSLMMKEGGEKRGGKIRRNRRIIVGGENMGGLKG